MCWFAGVPFGGGNLVSALLVELRDNRRRGVRLQRSRFAARTMIIQVGMYSGYRPSSSTHLAAMFHTELAVASVVPPRT